MDSLAHIDSLFAIVPAAGCGMRFGTGGASKTLTALGDDNLTVLELSVLGLLRANVCDGIVVAARSQEIELFQAKLDALKGRVLCDIPIIVVRGGETRQESVYFALQHVPKNIEWVAIHDAARPLCLSSDIRAVCDCARANGAAILASRINSTLKRYDDVICNKIIETVPRGDMWAAQTPQVFAHKVIEDAHERSRAEGYLGTDDSELVERLGHKVLIVAGSSFNIKITTKEDIILARALIECDDTLSGRRQ